MTTEITLPVELLAQCTGIAVITDENKPIAVQALTDLRVNLKAIEKQRKHLIEPVLETQRRINSEARKVSDQLELAERSLTKLLESFETAERNRLAEERRVAEEATLKIAAQMREDAERASALARAEADRVAKEAQAAFDSARTDADEEAALERLTAAQDAAKAAAREAQSITRAADIAVAAAIKDVAPERVRGSSGSMMSSTVTYRYELVDITKVPEEWLLPPAERLATGKLSGMCRSSTRPMEIPGLVIVEGSKLRTTV